MKKFILTLTGLIILLATSCEKDDITPSKSQLKQQIIDCRRCTGQWDLTDTVP